jgi:hypothetical protein
MPLKDAEDAKLSDKWTTGKCTDFAELDADTLLVFSMVLQDMHTLLNRIRHDAYAFNQDAFGKSVICKLSAEDFQMTCDILKVCEKSAPKTMDEAEAAMIPAVKQFTAIEFTEWDGLWGYHNMNEAIQEWFAFEADGEGDWNEFWGEGRLGGESLFY